MVGGPNRSTGQREEGGEGKGRKHCQFDELDRQKGDDVCKAGSTNKIEHDEDDGVDDEEVESVRNVEAEIQEKGEKEENNIEEDFFCVF